MVKSEKKDQDKTFKHLEVLLYLADNWNVPRILKELDKRTSVKQYAIMLHDKDVHKDGTPKPEHYHVYLNFGESSWTLAGVAKWFGIKPELVQKIKVDKAFTLRYYTHENQPEKHQYSIDDMVANFDVKAFLQQKKQSASLNALLRQCSKGEITRLNYTQYIDPVIFSRHQRDFEGAWKYHDADLSAQNGECSRQMDILWLHGDTGVGKSLLCKLLARSQKRSIYFTSTGKDPFGEYVGQTIAVLDDLRPGEPFSFSELLKITDPNNLCSVQSRYHNKVLVCSQLIITSALSPEDFVSQYHLQSEAGEQLYRRLSEVWEVTRSEVHISKYDLGLCRFAPSATIPNPVPAYLATLPPPASAFDGGVALTQLNAEYTPPSVSVAPAPSTGNSTPGGSSEAAAVDHEKEVLPF